MRVVDDLPFVPTTWTAREARLRIAERAHQRAHAREIEPDAEAQRATRALRARRRRYAPSASRRASSSAASSAKRLAFSRSASHERGGCPRDEALVGELARRALALGARGVEAADEARPQRVGEALAPHLQRRVADRDRAPTRPLRRRSGSTPPRLPSRSDARRSRSASAPPSSSIASGARGPRPASSRSRRRLRTASIAASTAASASASRGDLAGHGERARAASRPSPPAKRQSSSVTCGSTGMAEAQRAIEHEAQRRRDLRALGGIVPVEARLGRLEVPVADVVPDEAVERLDGRGEVVGVDQRRDLLDRAVEARQHPAVDRRRRRAAPARRRRRSIRIRRPAFQSLFVRPRPSSIMPSAKRTSCVELILSSP